MQHPYTGSIARNIPREMATLASERGGSITRRELLQEGFTEAQIDQHWPKAAEILRAMETRRAA